MRAKLVNQIMEDYDELVVLPDADVDELIDMIHNADHMLKLNIEPLLHTKADYKKARAKALKALRNHHRLSRSEIQDKLTEAEVAMNEAFDVLTWSRKHLPKEIADDIEEAHEGGYGEKLQTSLLKIYSKDELMDWFNKNFEVGRVDESDVADDHPWNQIYHRVIDAVQSGQIEDEEHLTSLIMFLNRHGGYNLSHDDIEDAAWAAWNDA